MASEPWRDKQIMYTLYVQKRMKLTDIQKYFDTNYGKTVSTQALYNWAKKHDLLKYRGKGRNLKAKTVTNTIRPVARPLSPMEQRMKEIRKRNAILKNKNKRR